MDHLEIREHFTLRYIAVKSFLKICIGFYRKGTLSTTQCFAEVDATIQVTPK